jgi:ssDNA-binding Zn-finger/Zn-ribbon topoisomerase 1
MKRSNTKLKCPKCGKELLKIKGNGFDKDLLTCISCDYEKYLETSTKPKKAKRNI